MIHLKKNRLEVLGYQTAKENNLFCGDSFYFTANDDYFLCVVADGLGSGKPAFESSQAVVAAVKSNPEETVDTLMYYSNKVLLHKRGAAVAILKVDFKAREFEYSGVGNVRFSMYPRIGKVIYPLSVRGYLSGRPQKYRTQKLPYEPGSKFLIHSDGFTNVANTKLLMTSCQSVPSLAEHLKSQQVNKLDDMTFIVGSLL